MSEDSLNEELENPIVIGDDYDYERFVDGIPDGASVETADFVVKKRLEDAESEAVIRKEVTTTAQQGVGQVLETGHDSAARAQVLIQLTSEETSVLNSRILYWYVLKVRTDTSMTFTVTRGRFLPVAPVTLP